jgi:putative sterol carrier protein
MSLTLPADAADWVQEWRDRINDREAFAEAAAEFSADFLFEIRADETYDGDPVRFRVDIEDGQCVAAAVVDETDYDFSMAGPYGAWKGMLTGELDVSEAAMDGTFDIEGNTMVLLRRQDSVSSLLGAAQDIDTAFEF